MAGEAVRLAERLRLGEKPDVVDWRLASAILEVRDAGSAIVGGVNDIVADRRNATKSSRFEVRVFLLSEAIERAARASELLHRRLQDYFELRAEEVHEDVPAAEDAEDDVRDDVADDRFDGDDEFDEDDGGDSEPSVEGDEVAEGAHSSRLSGVFEAAGVRGGGVAELAEASERLAADAAWLTTALADLIMHPPDVDASLDFASEVEMRFSREAFYVESGAISDQLRSLLQISSSQS